MGTAITRPYNVPPECIVIDTRIFTFSDCVSKLEEAFQVRVCVTGVDK